MTEDIDMYIAMQFTNALIESRSAIYAGRLDCIDAHDGAANTRQSWMLGDARGGDDD